MNYHKGPANNAATLGTVPGGTRVIVHGEALGWMDVELADGQRGFIYKRWLRPIGH